MRVRLAVCALVLLVAGLALAATTATAVDLKPEAPAAHVDGKTITVGQLEKECLARFGASTLPQMIDDMIVDQEAQKRKIVVTELEIVQRATVYEYSIEAERSTTGVDPRIAPRELFQHAKMELQLEKMVQGNVKVTDEEVSTYYRANRDKLRPPQRMLVSHIVVGKQADAERIRQDILAGKISFADAVRKYSTDPYREQTGGLLGWVVFGKDAIQKAVFAKQKDGSIVPVLQKDGDIAPVVQGRKGWEIIRRDQYQSGEVPPFEEMQPKIKEILRQRQIQLLAKQMLDELRKAANVETVIDFGALNDDVRQLVTAAEAQLPASTPPPGAAPAPAAPAGGQK